MSGLPQMHQPVGGMQQQQQHQQQQHMQQVQHVHHQQLHQQQMQHHQQQQQQQMHGMKRSADDVGGGANQPKRGRPKGSATRPASPAATAALAASEAGGKAMKRLFGMAAKMQVRTNVKEPTENEFTKIVLCVVRSGGIRGGKNGGRPDYNNAPETEETVRVFAPEGEKGFKDILAKVTGCKDVEFMSNGHDVENSTLGAPRRPKAAPGAVGAQGGSSVAAADDGKAGSGQAQLI